MININQAARAVLLDQLTRIANSGNVEALQALLSGAGLPALSRDAEPAEQIRDALESGDHYASLARRIAHLLAKLVLHRAESLEQRLAALEGAGMGGSSAQVYEPTYLQDENYVFNLFLLAARLPREQELFSGLQHFHDIGFKREVILASINNRVGFQLRRALAEQQHDKSLRAYWLDLLQEKNRQWNPARRTELLEAWHGLLGTFDFTADKQDALDTLDQGLCALHGSVEHHPQAIDLLELAVWRLENAYPLDPLTWINYLAPYWNEWPELLQDVAARTWPGLEPKAHEDMPPLLGDLNALWVAMSEDQQSEMNDFLRRNAAEGGRKFLQNLIFRPPVIADKSPQEVRTLLTKLGEHLWPTEKKAARNIQQHEPEDWEKEKPARGARRASFDRLARLNSVNQTLVEIESRLAAGDEVNARRFLDELLEQQRNSPLHDRHLHTAKTLAKAGAIVQRFGYLEWAESLLREACQENHNDKVSACGLADVLKARGELDAAEQQYRLNVARWPNNEVSACGLADVLKARGELDAAEQQYRLNVARWPNDEVSACGLADVLKARGELDAAESEYRNNVTRWPNNRVAKHGLANVLRKMKRHAEALTLLPESKGDGYDLHLRAMILLDLGRIEDARNSLNQGLQAAIGSKETALFHRGLALLALRSNDLPRASEILATLPDNVIPLDLMRLHLQAAEDHGTAAGKLVGALDARHTKMYSGEKRVFDLLRSGFDLHAEKIGRQPQQAELDEIFEAEIDLLLAA